jgi:hypothetical protein
MNWRSETALNFFVGRMENAADIRDLTQKSGIRKLDQLAQPAQRHSLPSAVVNAIRTVQDAVGEMTGVLQEDHRQLIQPLAVDETDGN